MKGSKTLSLPAPNNTRSIEALSNHEINAIANLTSGQVIDIHESDENIKILENYMNSQIIGQKEGISQIIKALSTGINRLEFSEGSLGAIFLGGPTGSGKTETIKELANYLLGSRDAFISVECEKYQEGHSQSAFFGTQDGYIGFGMEKPLHTVGKHYDEAKKSGKMNEMIADKPGFTIIFFDEAEKAHPNFMQSILSLIEEGKTDISISKGKNEYKTVKLDLRNTLFVFASNIGQHEISQIESSSSIGFIPQDAKSLKKEADGILGKAYRDRFSPEFRGRAGEPVVYQPITESSVKGIITKLLGNMNSEIQRYFVNTDIQVGLSEAAYQFIEEKGFDAKSGAREIKRTMTYEISNTVQKIIKKYADTPKFQKQHKNVIYFDTSEDGTLLEPMLHHIANHSPVTDVIETKTEIEDIYTNEKVSKILKNGELIQFLYDQFYQLGFSTNDITILMELDRSEIQSEIFRVENDDGLDINVYADAKGIFEPHTPRDMRKLVERMGKTMFDTEKYSRETFILALIVKSITTIKNILNLDELSLEQREIIARFAIISAFKIW